LYALVIYGALSVSLVICLLAKPLIGLLYGEAYLPAVIPLRIVVWYTAFSYLGGARNAWIVCENKQKYLKYLYCGAAVINILLNLLMIPTLGTAGAALASLITQISTVVLMPLLIRPLRPNVRLMLEALFLKGIFPKKTR
jgi:O-antigen/teichoic acid export membrane protein